MAPTPLIWLPIPGFKGFYEVSDMGGIRSLDRTIYDVNGVRRRLRGVTLVPQPQPSGGHLHVHLHRRGVLRQVLVHDVVTRTFLGPKPVGAWVRHLSGKCEENSLWNLEYNTPRENLIDAYVHGLRKTGAASHLAKHSKALVARVRALKDQMSSYAASEKLGVPARYVRRIWAGEIRQYD